MADADATAPVTAAANPGLLADVAKGTLADGSAGGDPDDMASEALADGSGGGDPDDIGSDALADGSAGGDPDDTGGRGELPRLEPSAGRALWPEPGGGGGRCDGVAPPRGSIGARGVNPGGAAEGRACATGCVRLGASTPGLVGMFSSASSVAVGTGLG